MAVANEDQRALDRSTCGNERATAMIRASTPPKTPFAGVAACFT
jgi:hypothetical protein